MPFTFTASLRSSAMPRWVSATMSSAPSALRASTAVRAASMTGANEMPSPGEERMSVSGVITPKNPIRKPPRSMMRVAARPPRGCAVRAEHVGAEPGEGGSGEVSGRHFRTEVVLVVADHRDVGADGVHHLHHLGALGEGRT